MTVAAEQVGITLTFPAAAQWPQIAPICELLTEALERDFPGWSPEFSIEWKEQE